MNALAIIAVILLIVFLPALFIMWLWNWLMPDIFGLTTVTFWQAWGLYALSWFLFRDVPTKKGD